MGCFGWRLHQANTTPHHKTAQVDHLGLHETVGQHCRGNLECLNVPGEVCHCLTIYGDARSPTSNRPGYVMEQPHPHRSRVWLLHRRSLLRSLHLHASFEYLERSRKGQMSQRSPSSAYYRAVQHCFGYSHSVASGPKIVEDEDWETEESGDHTMFCTGFS